MGASIKEIAGDKAGIIKKGIPTIMSNQSAEVKKILKAKCIENGSDVILKFGFQFHWVRGF